MQRIDEIRMKLVESRVIGRVLDDFNPRVPLYVFYGNKRHSLGDEVMLADVQSIPSCLQKYTVAFDQELKESFKNGKLVAIVCLIPIFFSAH